MAALATFQHLFVIAACLFVVYLSLFSSSDLRGLKGQSLLPFDFRRTWTRIVWLIIGVGGLATEIHAIATVGWASYYGRPIG